MTHPPTLRHATAFVAVALAAAACSAGADSRPEAELATTAAPTPTTAAPSPAGTTAPTDSPAPAPTDAAPATDVAASTPATLEPDGAESIEQVDQYLAEAAAFDQAGADIQFPQGLTFAAGGAPGYSRYVFRERSDGVVPTLVEGPIEGTVRCQDEALPCSYRDLAELHASGAPIPPALQMTADELAELVAQLDVLHAFAQAHRDVNDACAAGFVSDQIQTPNMGSHFYDVSAIGNGFDPGQPEILLYARADGTLPDGALAQCVDGAWTGEPMVLVGTAFIVPPQVIGDTHPVTFAGPIDNWHIHYNLCRANTDGRDTFLPKAECEAAGGNFSEALGWMLHAWVADDFDNQLGVFSMWNSSIAPALDAEAIRETRQVRGSDFPAGAEQSLIADFLYTGELTVSAGQPLFFNNVDAVPHTVTAGIPGEPAIGDFDSGLLTPGTNFAVTFDEPGTYSLFCSLHPGMVASVTVTE